MFVTASHAVVTQLSVQRGSIVKLVRRPPSAWRAVCVAAYEWQASDSLLSVMNLVLLLWVRNTCLILHVPEAAFVCSPTILPAALGPWKTCYASPALPRARKKIRSSHSFCPS